MAPSNPAAVEVFFNLGGQGNNASTTATVGLAGDGAGVVFAANGDLLLHDNGIDTPGNQDVSLSSDELNRIAAADLGVVIPDFGFPNTYVSAATGQTIANGVAVCDGICATPGVTPPRLVFRPIGTERSEGAVELALAPPGFPASFSGGVFSAFFGKFAGGAANDENPVVFSHPATGTYFHFIPNQLLGTKGTIYQMTSLESPPPRLPRRRRVSLRCCPCLALPASCGSGGCGSWRKGWRPAVLVGAHAEVSARAGWTGRPVSL